AGARPQWRLRLDRCGPCARPPSAWSPAPAETAGGGDAMNTIPKIEAGQVFTISTLTEALNLKAGTLPRELRLRRLRYAKRAGRVLILGEWVMQWLREGEVQRRSYPTTETKVDGGY